MKENCTNKDLLDLLNVCPYVIQKLQESNCLDLIDAYDALLFRYKMKFGTEAVFNGDTEIVLYWTYWYKIDGKKNEIICEEYYKTKAGAQLAAVHDTMYELNYRICSINDY